MRTISFLLQKEFRQIFRNRAILMLILVMPIMQLIILPLAADYEIKNINLSVVDHDHSPYSRQLISKITVSVYYSVQGHHTSPNADYRFIEQDRAHFELGIQHGCERNLIREGKQPLFRAFNGNKGVKAGLGGAYLATVIGHYDQYIRITLTDPTRLS